MRGLWYVLLVACEAGPKESPSPGKPAVVAVAADAAVVAVAADAAVATDAAAPAKLARECWMLDGSDRKPVPEPTGTRLAAHEVPADRTCPVLTSTDHLVDEETVRKLPVGFDVIPDAQAYRKRFKCRAPATVDFAKQRLAIYRFHRETPDFATLSYAVEDRGRIKLVVETSFACQGIGPVLHRTVLGFVIPREPVPVDLVSCARPQGPCPPGIP